MQQTSTFAAAPVQYQYGSNVVVVPAQQTMQTTTAHNYQQKKSTALGSTQLAIGCLCIIFNIIAMSTVLSVAPFIAHGIWGGVLFIVTGSLGISAGRTKSKCQIIAFMILCILSACAAAVVLSLGIIGALYTGAINCYYYYGNTYCEKSKYELSIAMNSLMAILGLIEGVVAIWGSAICCQAICCGKAQPMTVLTPANTSNNGQVFIYSQAQGVQQYPSTVNYPFQQDIVSPPAYQPGYGPPPSWNQEKPHQEMPVSGINPSAPVHSSDNM